MKVLTFGELLLRLSAPGYTRLFQKDSLDATFCGSEANVAVSLSILGMDTIFISKLPDNDIGKAASNSMQYFGVDMSNIIYGNGRMGTYYLEKGASQRPSKVIYDRSYSAIALAKAEEFDWNQCFDGVTWFHWSGITPALSDEMAKTCLAACKVAKKRGIIVSCDLNYRKNLWTSKRAQKVMLELMQYVDVCIGNEEDAEMMLGISPTNTDVNKAKLDNRSYERVAQQISLNFGCKYVAFTLRESYSASVNGWGAMLYSLKDDTTYFSKKYEVQLVDRVGGGDSFAAGIIYSLMLKKELQYTIDFSAAASCLKQTIEGDYNRSTYQEIEQLLVNGDNGRIQR